MAQETVSATMLSAERTTEIFRNTVTDLDVFHWPETLTWTAGTQNDEALTAATSDAIRFFATIYGSENLAAYVSAELLGDPVTKERTLAALGYLRGFDSANYNSEGAPTILGAGAAVAAAHAGGLESPEDLMNRVMASPDPMAAINELSMQDKQRVAGIADELLGTLENLPDTGIPEQFKRAVAIGATGNVSLALTPEQVATLETIQSEFGELGGLRQTGETSPLASVGIEQVRQLGDGVVVLDEDWAKTQPDQAYAVETWIHQTYPDLEIQYGRQGVWGSILDKFGLGVDLVTAPIAAGILQANELSQQWGNSSADRQRALEKADEIERRLQSGELSDDESEQALRDIRLLRDLGTVEVGWDQFKEDVFRNANPRQVGFGFADSMTRAAGLYPGDPGYTWMYAGIGILANVVADPVNWLVPGYGATRAARAIPKFRYVEGMLGTADEIADGLRLADPAMDSRQALAAAERILEEGRTTGELTLTTSQSWIQNSVYRRLAQFPEEMASTKPFMRAQERLWRLRTRLGPEEFSSALGMWGLDREVAHYISQTTSLEDMQLSLTRAMTGVNYTPPNVDQLMARVAGVTRRLDDPELVGPARAELIAERAWLTDTVRGTDWVRPIRSLPTARQLRQLERLADQPVSPFGRAFMHATESVEGFPSNLSTRKLFASIDHMFRGTGTGAILTFPHTSRFAAGARRLTILDDAVEESFESIVNIAKLFGVKKNRIRELMVPWTSGELTSAMKSYDWWKNTWVGIVDESPYLTASGKQDLRQMWDTLIQDRSPGYLNTQSVSGLTVPEPTLFREMTGARGERFPMGVPAFSADQFQSYRLMSLHEARQNLTITGRTMTEWANAGGAGKKAMSKIHQAAAETNTAVNSMWRSSTLGTRLFGALPGRIFSEQMLRIAAYDYASLVWHPSEWFASTQVGIKMTRGSDVALFADAPTEALGVMVDTVRGNSSLMRPGRVEVTINDGSVYWRSYSEKIRRLFASPEVHYWHMPNLGDPDATLGAMRAGRHADYGSEWLGQYDAINMDHALAIERSQQEIGQLIGSGPGADKIRAAINHGKMEIDGANVTAGSPEFADALERLYSRGDWVPETTYLPRSLGDYLPAQRETGLAHIRDFLFRNFYTRPDLALSRSPLYRQMAAREFRNLVRRGYTPENALKFARARAARGTADMMFTIGAKTSGEFFLRNLSPFFPAWRELAATWLYRLPTRVGRGNWALGATAIARRADVWLETFKNIGIVREDEQGKLFVPIPGLDKMVGLLTGADTSFEVTAPLESFVGILPVPIGVFGTDEEGNALPWHERLRGVLPSLGAPSSVGLGVLNDLMHGGLDDAENWLTMFGTDQSLGPVAVDRFLEAFNIDVPWMSGTTRDYHDAMKTWAVIDGMRIAWAETPPPDSTDYDEDGDGNLTPEEQTTYGAAYKVWAEDLAKRGERYATGTYLMRGIAGMVLPFSIQINDEGKQQMAALWGLINALPDAAGGRALQSALIDSVLTEYPALEPYMTGKTQDTRRIDDPDETINEFMQAVKDGEIKMRSTEDWIVFSMGMNSYSIYQSRIDAIYEEAGGTPAEWLVNFDAKDAVQSEHEAWQDFLDLSTVVDNYQPGQVQSFMDMFNTYQGYKRIRDGESPRLSIEQEQLLKFDRSMKEYARFFSPNSESSADYYKMREEAFEALGTGAGSDLSQGVSWWFQSVSDEYYTRRNELYDKLDTVEERDKGPIYAKIRALADEYNREWIKADHPEWGSFPSPEEYVFLKLSPLDRRLQIADWANLPASFLTEFQRQQVGYDVPEGKQDAANKLADLMAINDRKFEQYIVQNDLSYSSTAVKDARARLTDAYALWAKDHGLEDYWAQSQEPEYHRIDLALGLSQTVPAWKQVSKWADGMRSYIEAQGYSPAGTSDLAEKAHRWLVEAVETARRDDHALDGALSQLSTALGEKGKPLANDDLVLRLFFGVFDTSNAYYLD